MMGPAQSVAKVRSALTEPARGFVVRGEHSAMLAISSGCVLTEPQKSVIPNVHVPVIDVAVPCRKRPLFRHVIIEKNALKVQRFIY